MSDEHERRIYLVRQAEELVQATDAVRRVAEELVYAYRRRSHDSDLHAAYRHLIRSGIDSLRDQLDEHQLYIDSDLPTIREFMDRGPEDE
jgi:hypothetical protein